MSRKWPEVELAPDWLDKLKDTPTQAWWADEDEPWVRLPTGQGFPVRVALRHGLVREVAILN